MGLFPAEWQRCAPRAGMWLAFHSLTVLMWHEPQVKTQPGPAGAGGIKYRHCQGLHGIR